jgi:hypothetical protein
VLAWLLRAASAGAEPRQLVVVLGREQPAIWPALDAELRASGFEPRIEVGASFPLDLATLERASFQHESSIGMAPLPAESGVEIWSVDRQRHRPTYREVWLGLYGPTDPPEVIAVRLVELLRRTVIELDQHPEQEQAPPPQPATRAPAWRPEPPPRFYLGVGGGSALSPGGLGLLPFVDTSLAWFFNRRFGAVLDGGLSPVPLRLRSFEGEANVEWYHAGAALRFCVTNPSSTFQLRSGFGTWLSFFSTRGAGASGYVGRSASLAALIPHIDLGIRQALTSRVGVSMGTAVGMSVPGVTFNFAGRDVATWGRPLWLGQVQIEVALD